MGKIIQNSIIWLVLVCLLVSNYMFYGDVLLSVMILGVAFLAGMSAKGW